MWGDTILGVSHANDDPSELDRLIDRLVDWLAEFFSRIPESDVPPAARPLDRAAAIRDNAARRAALWSGGLALPAGPVGWLTVLPDLYKIWRVQAQMVSDISAAFGVHAQLTREQMVYCLFRHAAGQMGRALLVRVGERVLVRKVKKTLWQRILRAVGVRVTQRVANRSVARVIPVFGALAVGSFSFYDTRRVGNTAIEMFTGRLAIPDDTGNDAPTDALMRDVEVHEAEA